MNAGAGLAGAVVGGAVGPLLHVAACRFPGVRRDVWRLTAVTLAAAAVIGAVCARLAPQPRDRYLLPALIGLALVGLLLAVIDLDTRRLPDVITLPSYPGLLAMLATASLLASDWDALLRAAAAAAVAVVLHGALAMVAPRGMGFGDVKLAGLLGLALGWLSWSAAVLGVALGFVFGAAASLGLVLLGRASMRSEVPFGPAMLAGALTAVLFGDDLAALYLSW